MNFTEFIKDALEKRDENIVNVNDIRDLVNEGSIDEEILMGWGVMYIYFDDGDDVATMLYNRTGGHLRLEDIKNFQTHMLIGTFDVNDNVIIDSIDNNSYTQTTEDFYEFMREIILDNKNKDLFNMEKVKYCEIFDKYHDYLETEFVNVL